MRPRHCRRRRGWLGPLNTIHGPVTLTGNLGSTAPAVEANHIGGPLACLANTPPSTDNSQPNTVTGPASGQCATLA